MYNFVSLWSIYQQPAYLFIADFGRKWHDSWCYLLQGDFFVWSGSNLLL